MAQLFKHRRFPGSNEKGLALIFSLVLLVLLSVMGIYGINTSTVEGWRSSNDLNSKQAYYAAKAGIEDGISRLVSRVVSDKDSETSTTWNNGTTYNSANFNNSFTITHRVVGKTAEVATTNGNPHYLISSTGFSGPAQKQIKAVITMKITSPFSKAVRGCSQVSMTGGVLVDSYDSTFGTYASQALNTDPQGYTFAKNNGSIATANDSGTISLSSWAAIHGNATATSTSGHGTITTLTGATIYGTSTPNAAPSTCDTLNLAAQAAQVQSQYQSQTWNDIKLIGTNQTITGGSSPILVKTLSLTSNSTLTITGSGPVTMYVSGGITIDSTSRLIVSSGVDLTLGFHGNVSLAGSGIVNQSAIPGSLALYGYDIGTVNLYQSSPFYGAVYTPSATISVNSTKGSGEIYGSLIGKTVAISGTPKIHFDEALQALSGIGEGGWSVAGYNPVYVLGQ